MATTDINSGTQPIQAISSEALTPATLLNIPAPTPLDTATPDSAVASAVTTSKSVDQYIKDLTPTPTAADQQNQDLLNSIASLTGQEGQKGQDQLTAEQNAGIPQLQTTLQNYQNELNTATAAYDKKYANADIGIGQTTNDVLGQQGAIRRAEAADIGVIQAKISAAQGNLTLAQNQVNRAIDLKYSTIESQIATKKAQLDALAPTLNEEEKVRAQAQAQKLQDEQQAIADKKDLEKQIQSIALQAASNGATSGIVNAIENAKDVKTATQLATQYLAKAETQVVEVNGHSLLIDSKTGKTIQDLGTANSIIQARINNSSTTSTGSTTTDSNGNPIPDIVAPYLQTTVSGTNWVDASTLQGTDKQKTDIIQAAQKSGYKIITNKNTAADLVNIGDAQSKLNTIGTIFAGIGQPNALSRDLYGLGLTKFAQMTQSNPQKAAAGALQSVGLDILKAISGVQGFRGNQSAIQQVTAHLPTIYDTTDVVNQKINYINQLISDRENSILGKTKSSSAQQITQPDGTVWKDNGDGTFTRIK